MPRVSNTGAFPPSRPSTVAPALKKSVKRVKSFISKRGISFSARPKSAPPAFSNAAPPNAKKTSSVATRTL